MINSQVSNVGNVAQKVSLYKATGSVSKMAYPFVLSRLAVAVNILANGFVTPYIGPAAVAAGPVMISAAYAIIGPARSFLLSTGILISKLQGEIDELKKTEGNEALIQGKKEAIGKQLRQSSVFGLMWAAVTAGVMVSVAPVLSATGMNEEVVQNVRGFLNHLAIGLLPIYWSTSDQQFALGTHRKYLPMFFGTLFPILSMAIGYPLALAANMGTSGLGLGISLASWISFIALRLYYLKSELKDYQIYKPQFSGLLSSISDLCSLGVPKAFQSLSEWGNLFILSQLLVNLSKDAAMAANASFQIIAAFTVISSGLGQAVSVKVSGQLGMMKAANEARTTDNVTTYNKNSKRLGNAGILIGTLGSAAVALILFAFSKAIQSVFLTKNTDDYDHVMNLGVTMLITNGFGLIGDTLSNVSASALAGSKDVIFSPAMRMLFMSAIGLPVGWYLVNKEVEHPNILFIVRNVGIILSALAIGIRWALKDHLNTLVGDSEKTKINSGFSYGRFYDRTGAEGDETDQSCLDEDIQIAQV